MESHECPTQHVPVPAGWRKTVQHIVSAAAFSLAAALHPSAHAQQPPPDPQPAAVREVGAKGRTTVEGHQDMQTRATLVVTLFAWNFLLALILRDKLCERRQQWWILQKQEAFRQLLEDPTSSEAAQHVAQNTTDPALLRIIAETKNRRIS